MGEVYRARDSNLNRDVALKVRPVAFALDTDRYARFIREAQIVASLNHPNIAAIYGFENAGGIQALVLELVEGPTVASRIAKGRIPIKEALSIAMQIAEGLAAAHKRGIVHSDLKPANIKLRPDGTVKILDFGLAKAYDAADEPAAPEATGVTGSAIPAGLIVGTAAYMSPEQARGEAVDKRTDIWAFGCVLFESLTGRPAFRGETVRNILNAVLNHEPDWTLLPAETPAGIAKLLRRCLEKNADRRVHDIADARIEIEDALAAPMAVPAKRPVTGVRGCGGRRDPRDRVLGVGGRGLAAPIKPGARGDNVREAVDNSACRTPGHSLGQHRCRWGWLAWQWQSIRMAHVWRTFWNARA